MFISLSLLSSVFQKVLQTDTQRLGGWPSGSSGSNVIKDVPMRVKNEAPKPEGRHEIQLMI